jgi:hypothetical protein
VTMAWRIRMLLMWCQVRLVVISSNGGNMCHVNLVVIIYSLLYSYSKSFVFACWSSFRNRVKKICVSKNFEQVQKLFWSCKPSRVQKTWYYFCSTAIIVSIIQPQLL